MNVLVVDDEKDLRESLSSLIANRGHRALAAASGEEALAHIASRAPDSPDSVHLVLLDVNLPGIGGLQLLPRILAHDPTILVSLITAHGCIRDAVGAIRDGAYNYLEKPIEQADVDELLRKAAESHSLATEMGLSSPKITLDGGEEFIGRSQSMRSVFELIQRLGRVNTSVLIRGENGSGKELVARAIHFNSPRKERPFVAVNCGAIPENLVESEFFGHEKGAFTGASERYIGKFQYAEGGTLFLDEVGELSQAMQVKLLRVLQERRFSPIRSNREIRCDVRIIAATNRDLEAMIREGRFREDFFYRLNVLPITLPSLRDRPEDIPTLVRHFVEKFNRAHSRKGTETEVVGVREDALALLRGHRWPGNIRELENAIERAFVLENSQWITPASLPEAVRPRSESQGQVALSAVNGSAGNIDPTFSSEKGRFERDFIVEALRRNLGRINQTASHAGIPKNTLLRKIRKYAISPGEYALDHPQEPGKELSE